MTGSIVLITGASGSGTTTLGGELAGRLHRTHLDTDDFYWTRTAPPYQEKRPMPDRLDLLRSAIAAAGEDGCVLSGSLDPWGDPLMPQFQLVVFLSVATEPRIARLEARERQRYGDAIAPGGPLRDASRAFVEWAAGYETGVLSGRNRARHEAWLARLPCPVLRLDGADHVDLLVRRVVAMSDSA